MNLDCVSETRLKLTDRILRSLNLYLRKREQKIKDEPRFGGRNPFPQR